MLDLCKSSIVTTLNCVYMNVVQVETQACGSGACAAAAVGIMQGLLDNKVQVDLPGGSLLIEWEGVGSPLLYDWRCDSYL